MRPDFTRMAQRLIVKTPIANVIEPLGGQMIQRVRALIAAAGTEPAARRLAARRAMVSRIWRITAALFLGGILSHADIVGDAVAEPFPFSLIAFLDNRRMMRADIGVEQHAWRGCACLSNTSIMRNTPMREP